LIFEDSSPTCFQTRGPKVNAMVDLLWWYQLPGSIRLFLTTVKYVLCDLPSNY
jgi:hypothetical protein